MKLSKLQELLKSEAISQEEYDEMAKTAEREDPLDDSSESGPPNNSESPEDSDPDGKLMKMIQAAVDRATHKLGNENKLLKDKLEKTRKEKLSDDELRQVELQEKETELAQKEREIREKENRMYAIKALKKAELDDGSEETLELVEFVLGEDETAIELKVKALQKFAQRVAKSTTDEIYKTNGRVPERGSAGGRQDNPWSRDSWNLTEQMKLEINNPEQAKTMKASAGK